MRQPAVGAQRTVFACAVVAAALLGCGTEEEPQQVDYAADATVCTVRSAGNPWWVATFPSQTGKFHVEVQATPYNNNIDAVIGISKGAASTWTKLAAIVRFAPTGVIDVRKGGTYAADVNLPYVANTTYFFRIDIDVRAHVYSVGVKNYPTENYRPLATNYPFRTEQASVTSLDSAAVYLEPSRPGSIQICNLNAIKDDSTADGCVTSTAGGTFANAWMEPRTGALISQFTATPSANAMDGVVGYTVDAADAYNDYAASIRFYTNGHIEARDGDVYRASNELRYVAGQTYNFFFVTDLASSTYSVLAEDSTGENWALIADNFKFRPQQVGITQLGNVATIVASSAGQVRACRYMTTSPRNLANVRAGNYTLAAFRDGRTAISSSLGTQILDSRGVTTQRSNLVATRMTTDAAGNLYLASTDPGTTVLTLQSVTGTFGPRWTHTYAINGSVNTLGVLDNGDIAIALGAPGHAFGELLLAHSDGTEYARYDLTRLLATAAGIGRTGFVIAYHENSDFVVESRALDNTVVWQRRWTANASAYQIVVEPNGSVVLGGLFGEGGVNFGDGYYEPFYSSEVILNGYILALDANGQLRWSHRTFSDGPYSLSSNGDRIAYSTTQWSQMPHPQLFVYDRAGTALQQGYLYLTEEGYGWESEVAVDSNGRVILNATLKNHASSLPPVWSVLTTLTY